MAVNFWKKENFSFWGYYLLREKKRFCACICKWGKAIYHERFGSHVHILNWALHLDESTPHIHERHVFDCENQYGEIAPQQEKALEALGFELPEPEKPVGRKNNRKMTFDSACRVLLFDVAKKHGLQLEEEPEYGGRAYLEKQDYMVHWRNEKHLWQNRERRC